MKSYDIDQTNKGNTLTLPKYMIQQGQSTTINDRQIDLQQFFTFCANQLIEDSLMLKND